MKKRIYSIMDNGRKKTGVAILCGTLLITMVTGMAFAASTSEQKGPTSTQHDYQLYAQTVSEADQSMMSRFDPETGTTYYSWDLGKTWTPLTDEAYDAMFPSPVVEWWAYDEYKVWMDEQIKALQALADDGVSDYFDKSGALRDFTQADVDEAATLYRSILENIKNGYRVSKSIDGSTDSAISYNPQDIVLGTAETYAVASSSGNVATGYDYSKYASYGLIYDPKTEGFYYNGEMVRRFYDERASSTVTRTFNPSGIVDVTAIRNENDALIGLYKHSPQEFDERTKAMTADTALSVTTQYAIASGDRGEEPVHDYNKYAAFGLTYDKATRRLYYKGELVRYFEDSYPLGEGMASYIDHFDEDGTIDVHAIRDLSKIAYNPDGSYDPSGVLVGVEPYSQAEYSARDITQYMHDNLITQIAIAGSIEEDIRPYKDFGVSYDSRTGMMAYDGFPVREIFNPHLGMLITLSNGTGFPSGSIPDGAIDLTAIYENGVLTGLTKSTPEEFEKRTRERLQTVGATMSVASSDESNPDAQGMSFEQIFEKFKADGITFDPNSRNGGLGNVYYYGKLVKTFVDEQPNGGVISFSSSDGGEITVRTIYDNAGKLIGLEVTRA